MKSPSCYREMGKKKKNKKKKGKNTTELPRCSREDPVEEGDVRAACASHTAAFFADTRASSEGPQHLPRGAAQTSAAALRDGQQQARQEDALWDRVSPGPGAS